MRSHTRQYLLTPLLIISTLILLITPAALADGSEAAMPQIISQSAGGSYAVYSDDPILSVVAIAGDGGSLSFQWYRSTDGRFENRTLISGAADSSFVISDYFSLPSLQGENYFLCSVTNTVSINGQESAATVFSGIIKVTLLDNKVHGIDIRSIIAPSTGAVPDTDGKAAVSGSFQGYDIVKISWSPADSSFKPATVYTVKVKIKLWENAVLADDCSFRIDGKSASGSIGDNGSITVSYTFPATAKVDDEQPEDTPPIDTEETDETEESTEESSGESTEETQIITAESGDPRMPIITEQPRDLYCKKDDIAKITVKAHSVIDNSKLRYVWYHSEYAADGTWEEVSAGNGSDTLIVDTSAVGTGFYYATVIDESISGLSFSLNSEIAFVEVGSVEVQEEGFVLPRYVFIGGVLLLFILVLAIAGKRSNRHR